MNIAVIIPSKTAANLNACIGAVRENELGVDVFAIDDGVDWSQYRRPTEGDNVWSIAGTKPFVFSRNVNLGMTSALRNHDRSGVVVLNDDALLRTPGGFTLLAHAAAEHPEYGIIAATCNNVGNKNQWPRGTGGLRDEPRMVCMVCVYIPRTTIETVGMLDERYVDYGIEDDDYSLRVRKAGLKIGIHDGCYVDHGSLTSSYRGGPAAGGDFRPNLARFIAKWGHDNWGRPA